MGLLGKTFWCLSGTARTIKTVQAKTKEKERSNLYNEHYNFKISWRCKEKETPDVKTNPQMKQRA